MFLNIRLQYVRGLQYVARSSLDATTLSGFKLKPPHYEAGDQPLELWHGLIRTVTDEGGRKIFQVYGIL
jgi:hypothetical protein